MNALHSFDNHRYAVPAQLGTILRAEADRPWPEDAALWLDALVAAETVAGPGFVVLTGLAAGPPALMRTVCLRLSQHLGRVVAQDAAGTTVREVADRGTRIAEGVSARYADSRFGGSLHTDGAESPFPVPDYFCLLCVRQAPRGGALRLVHVDDVVAGLTARPGVLDELRNPFYFDRRGDQRAGEEPATRKPILFDDGGLVCVTYLREYVDRGHQHPHAAPLTGSQRRALDLFDQAISDPAIGMTDKLRPGEFAIFNNKRILHERTTFEDSGVAGEQRLLYRTWIRSEA